MPKMIDERSVTIVDNAENKRSATIKEADCLEKKIEADLDALWDGVELRVVADSLPSSNSVEKELKKRYSKAGYILEYQLSAHATKIYMHISKG